MSFSCLKYVIEPHWLILVQRKKEAYTSAAWKPHHIEVIADDMSMIFDWKHLDNCSTIFSTKYQ